MLGSDWNFETVAKLLKSEIVLPDPLQKWSGVSIDTRSLTADQAFFALRGKDGDGHDHLWDAFRKGANGAVIRKDFLRETREKLFRERALFRNLIPVQDPEEALGSLSGHYRSCFSAVGVGVTGSVGKTGTKEFLSFLLGQKYPILSSKGNFNNHLGLPLILFQLQAEQQYCVAEMGASAKGEIRKLSALLKPQVGVITGISPAHLEGFGSLEGIYEAKLELADALMRTKGTLVLPDGDPVLIERGRKRKVPILLFGKNKGSDFCLTGCKVQDGWVRFEVNGRWEFRFPGHATFQADNALAAIAACFACGVSISDLPSVWKDVQLSHGRFEVLSPREGVTFVNDCYNASPYSFERSLEAFKKLEGGVRKILVLGDMLELGLESAAHHRELGQKIQKINFQALLSYGDWIRESIALCEETGNPPLVLHFEDKKMLAHFLGNFLRSGDQVLFKASRGMKLEEVIDALSQPVGDKAYEKLPSQ